MTNFHAATTEHYLPTPFVERSLSLANAPSSGLLSHGTVLFRKGSVTDFFMAERFRILAANIELNTNSDVDSEHSQVLLVTSAAPEEGKSFTAVNVSRALAETGNGKTLLIDCDFRRPTLNQYFQLADPQGITNLLSQELAFDQSSAVTPPFNMSLSGIVHSVEPDLDLINAGTAYFEPVRAAGSSLLKKLISECRHHYRYIIIDCGPVLLAPEPLIISGMVDSTLFVLKAWNTERSLVDEALKCIGRKNILGIVMNHSSDGLRWRRYQPYYRRRS